ncbi:MAG: SWIM zinc finger family protein [Saprospiraceae bacterium]|nr:SWIM zinc finger family protein [Saprospiraceae bacterium]
MTFPFRHFEDHINQTILKRGMTYFRKGHVEEVIEHGHGEYEAYVHGTESYLVQITIKGENVTDHRCDCPFDQGPVCKHVIAVLFSMQKDELDFATEPKPVKKTGQAKKTARRMVEDILKDTPPEALQEFCRGYARSHHDFRQSLILAFPAREEMADKQTYVSMIRAILRKGMGRMGFIDWQASREVRHRIEEILDMGKKKLAEGHGDIAFAIATAILEEMTANIEDIDDSAYNFEQCIEDAIEIMEKLADSFPDQRQALFTYAVDMTSSHEFEEWRWKFDLLEIALASARTTEEFAIVRSLAQECDRTPYMGDWKELLLYRLAVNEYGEDAGNQFLMEHLHNPQLRAFAFRAAMNKQQFDKARQLAMEGIDISEAANEKEQAGWYRLLLEVAVKTGDQNEILNNARFLAIHDYQDRDQHLQLLKDNLPETEWKAWLSSMIEEASNRKYAYQSTVHAFLVFDQRWDELFQVLKTNNENGLIGLGTIKNYESQLKENYSHQVALLYRDDVLRHVGDANQRKDYEEIAYWIRRMKKLGANEEASDLINELTARFPRRRALLEELGQV